MGWRFTVDSPWDRSAIKATDGIGEGRGSPESIAPDGGAIRGRSDCVVVGAPDRGEARVGAAAFQVGSPNPSVRAMWARRAL
ncbi:hypothetical protein GCM10010095_56880 [Streptomyces anthocyanicus]|nr:hypothetical protein GCM10010095_56880 [Streptomyces anthocyanicus]